MSGTPSNTTSTYIPVPSIISLPPRDSLNVNLEITTLMDRLLRTQILELQEAPCSLQEVTECCGFCPLRQIIEQVLDNQNCTVHVFERNVLFR